MDAWWWWSRRWWVLMMMMVKMRGVEGAMVDEENEDGEDDWKRGGTWAWGWWWVGQPLFSYEGEAVGLWCMMVRLGLVNRVFFFLSSLDFFSLKTSSSSSTLETLAQLNNYENNIFHKLLILDRLYSQACKTRTSTSSLLFI